MASSGSFGDVDAVVAIPVRDEVQRIGDCLTALARQDGAAAGVVLLVNNTTDATVARVAELVPTLGMPVEVIETIFPPERANAGEARRAAMEAAAALAGEGRPLLCTDADGRAAPDWLARNLWHLCAGLDAVFGRAEIDPVEAARIPPALHRADAEECAYGRLLDEIEHWLDPDADDPWPRHTEHSGASIAVTQAAYHRVGGIPAVPLGEDRAFAAALRAVDARVRHAMDVRVVVSGRILGRAVGGMADTIRRRLVAPDLMVDDALEPVRDRMARVRLRRSVRTAFRAAQDGHDAAYVAMLEGSGLGGAGIAMRETPFGAAWAAIGGAVPQMRLPVSGLVAETARATDALQRLRAMALVA